MSEFKKAEKKRVKLKLALTGPSGSGKTYSALLIAKGLGGKIAVIDTENGSASLYADLPDMPAYDTLEIASPFHTDKYLEAIHKAVKGGYTTIIIDSISHQWNGEGGIMDRMDKEKLARPSVNSYTLWSKYTPEHERFKNAIVGSPVHIIATMRSKQDYVLQTNEKGKSEPKKVGMAPVQRDQFEYEFTTVFDLSMEHYSTTSKDRTHLFDGMAVKPTAETGERLLAWLSAGSEEDVRPVFAAPSVAKPPQYSTPKNAGALNKTMPVPDVGRMNMAKEFPEEGVFGNVDPGEFVVPIGKKYIGQKLKDIDPVELKKFAKWLVDESNKTKQALSDDGQRLVDHAGAHLENLKKADAAATPFDENEYP